MLYYLLDLSSTGIFETLVGKPWKPFSMAQLQAGKRAGTAEAPGACVCLDLHLPPRAVCCGAARVLSSSTALW